DDVGRCPAMTGTDVECVFCDIVEGRAPVEPVKRWDDAVAITPKGAVVAGGHILILPKQHVRDMRKDPDITGLVAKRGAELANILGWSDNNYATNCGEWGGQTVDHLHGHLLEAGPDQQHTMPWFGQKLCGDRRFFVGVDNAGDMTLWTGSADRPMAVAARHQLDDMDPVLWPLVIRVLQPTQL
ncbi:MAG TPA: HIT domain-containing protein, partial [Propionibacteriaceae bacterium]|nr:HIT domain-containing protein [Propionibacteriaceae bacterium]